MNNPAELKYTKTHEWLRMTGEAKAQIGLTDHAQHSLGDLVFVNLPEKGDTTTAGEEFSDVESVKAVSGVFSPVSGNITAVNSELLDSPEKINEAPYGAWFVEVSDITGYSELLTADEYEAFVKAEEEKSDF
ncbi:Glycine cleavage system H protein [bioreactor metagenome]|uniref:Glycine cleavage system H protein n=1 Tax=bioreactor metagenome TaxID=1076179 RepID=A0A645DVA5_9ZZZZ|nr:glycine cleavage system protein GcvH [Lachnospiraceae bacterium]